MCAWHMYLEPLHDEAEGGELTAAVADQLVRQVFRKHLQKRIGNAVPAINDNLTFSGILSNFIYILV